MRDLNWDFWGREGVLRSCGEIVVKRGCSWCKGSENKDVGYEGVASEEGVLLETGLS